MQLQVFRVETSNGEGPYRGSLLVRLLADLKDCGVKIRDPWHNPAPHECFGDDWDEFAALIAADPDQWLFGFRNQGELYRWFDDEILRANMRECEFVVAWYDVEAKFVKFGNRQLMFDRRHARRGGHELIKGFIEELTDV